VAPELVIAEVRGRRDIKRFISLPDKIYSGDSHWVPRLDLEIKHLLGDKNPFWKHAEKKLFLALRNGNAVGRAAAVIDHNFVDFHNEKTGFFGFFESVEDRAVSSALLDACCLELRSRGMRNILGPMNPSSNDQLGILVEGFNASPRIMMPYNPRYYPDLIESSGFEKAKDLLAVNMEVGAGPAARLEKFVKKIRRKHPGLRSRPIDKKRFAEEVKLIRGIYNSAWEKNWGFVPWTDEEIDDLAAQMKGLVIPGLIQIGFEGDTPAGFLLALPDYNEVIKRTGRRMFPLGWAKFLYHRNRIKNLRLMAMGVVREYRNKGIGPIMYYNSLRAALEKGFRECEFSWILEDNRETLKVAAMMGGEVYKRYRVYKKDLT